MIPRRVLPLVVGAAVAAIGSGAGLGTVSAAAAGARPYGTTWVADHGSDAITAYAPGTAGNAAPVATISGGRTGLDHPTNVATDDVGNVFVTNFAANSVTEYAAGASGNAAPVTTISGSATGLNGPSGIVVSGTDLWVSNSNSDVLERFATTSSGNTLPYATIYGAKTLLDNPTALALSPNAARLWAVNAPLGGTPSLTEFASRASGNAAPLAVVTGGQTQLSGPTGIAVDPSGRAWVTDGTSNAVTAYSGGGNRAPVATIAGNKTGLSQPAAIGFDAVGNPTVTNLGGAALEVFGKGASGNVAPTRTVSGAATGLSAPTGVAVYASTPGSPQSLTSKAGSGLVHLSWAPPADNGGGIIGYVVLRSTSGRPSGAGSASAAHLTTTATSYTARHLTNGTTYTFEVVAVNLRGAGTASSTASATPAARPGAPRHLRAVARPHGLLVSWKAPRHNGGRRITAYRIRYATCSIGARGCVAPSIRVKGSSRSLLLRDVAPGRRYHIQVAARNAIGYGAPATVTATL